MPTLTKEQPQSAATQQDGTSFQFLPPAMINDFPNNPAAHDLLLKLWNQNLTGFTEQAMAGNTWNNVNTPPPPNYYNPAFTTPPTTPIGQGIPWNPFPGRFQTYYASQLSAQQLLELGDTGYYTDGSGNQQTFPAIPQYPCTYFDGSTFPDGGGCGCAGNTTATIPYGPYGPRGWQDEYCEWSVTRDANGNITRVDFTCENPEYWNTLWMVDPNTVLSLYQSTLGKPQIQLEDLYLTDSNGKTVIDPGTGKPAYNPLNKWNSGPLSTSTQGGAMHLTSTPNTIQTEMGLAAAATILRSYPGGGQIPSGDIQGLICSAQYGQFGRNSDPHIGAGVNKITSAGYSATLYNPPGLYIQLPANLNTSFSIKGVSDITPYFNVSRKGPTVTLSGITYQLNLHLTVEAPAGQPPLSEMSCSGSGQLKWASQITQNLQMAILAAAFTSNKQSLYACSVPATINLFAQPLQLFFENIFTAMLGTNIPNPVNFPMSLLSNSTYVPPMVTKDNTYTMVLTYSPINGPSSIDPSNPATWPTVTFDDAANITVNITNVLNTLNYAVPGNSYPSPAVALYITVSIAGGAAGGLHGLYIADVGQTGQGAIMPALLNIKISEN